MMMDRPTKRRLLGAFFVLLALAVAAASYRLDAPAALAADGPATVEEAGVTRLVVETGGGAVVFQVELAVTPSELVRGLQDRRHLAPDAGMLFDFGPERIITMWMKNTYIPLDMVFIDAGGIVADIAERAEPLSLEPIASPIAVRAVLEVNAGTAERVGIRAGDRVRHPIFSTR